MNEQLDLIADYADLLAAQARDADRTSMETARTMNELYEKREWVAEWLEQKPRPKNGGSNRWTEDSRERFGQWLAWKQTQRQRQTLARTHTWRLMMAARIERASNIPPGNIRSERAIRPLSWAFRNKHDDELPQIMAAAIDAAGGDPARLTEKSARDGLDAWKHQRFGTRRNGTPRTSKAATDRAAVAAGKAKALRAEIKQKFAELYELTAYDDKAMNEYTGLINELGDFLDAHDVAAA